ncbi:MAG: ThiF family adenylyltransferase [Pirellulaceae bacterium]
MDASRYSANILSFGQEGQQKLLQSRAVVIGLGGLGGFVLEQLARIGVGHIVGADHDSFEAGNLNRQLLSGKSVIGRAKALVAADRVSEINPSIAFTAHHGPFQSLDESVFRDADVVFDCLDSIPERRELAARCDSAAVVLIHGAICGWNGQVGVCPPGADMVSKLYDGKQAGAEKKHGNLVFTAARAASEMVAEGMKIVLDIEPPRPRIRFFDMKTGETETYREGRPGVE